MTDPIGPGAFVAVVGATGAETAARKPSSELGERLLLVMLPGALERGESGVESGEGLLDASRVVQGDAGGAQAGDAEGHRDAMVAVAGDVRRLGLGRADLDPVAAHLDWDAAGAEVLRACFEPVAFLDAGVVDVFDADRAVGERGDRQRVWAWCRICRAC